MKVSLDILDHDDRVIDNDADREHETKQGQIVQRYAQRIEDREGSDERNRYGDDGNDRGAPALQEQEDNADHEQDGDEDRDYHFFDGLSDEYGRIVYDLVRNARREALGQGLHRRDDLMLYRQ